MAGSGAQPTRNVGDRVDPVEAEASLRSGVIRRGIQLSLSVHTVRRVTKGAPWQVEAVARAICKCKGKSPKAGRMLDKWLARHGIITPRRAIQEANRVAAEGRRIKQLFTQATLCRAF